MEDLHWADTSSIDLILSLFRLAENRRILFINVFRPHYQETGGKVRAFLKEDYAHLYTEIELKPLDADQSDLLIDNLLKIKGLPINIRNQKQAFKWYSESIKEGEKQSANLELSHTYREVAHRLQDTKSRLNRFNGLGAEEYSEKARELSVA